MTDHKTHTDVEVAAGAPAKTDAYEAPKLTVLGGFTELTLGHSPGGTSDGTFGSAVGSVVG